MLQLAQRSPAPAPAPGAVATPAAPVLVSAAPPDLTPQLTELTEAIRRLAEVRPALATAPVMVAAPPAASAVSYAAPDNRDAAALVGSMDLVLQLLPRLKEMAIRARGPRAKAIVMDAGLVRALDALQQANSLSEVLEALAQL